MPSANLLKGDGPRFPNGDEPNMATCRESDQLLQVDSNVSGLAAGPEESLQVAM